MNNVQAKRNAPPPPERRSFLVRFSAAAISVFAVVAPFFAGWGVAVDPLYRRKRSPEGAGADGNEFIRVASLDALPADGTPRMFVLEADRNDAWTRVKNERIGTVYLSRDDSAGEPKVMAFSALCPHLGCVVDFNVSAKKYACPCHEASFSADGARVSGPSKRGLDELPVELRASARGAQEIFVAYKKFLPGIAERTPIA